MIDDRLLARAHGLARDFLEGVSERPVGPRATLESLRASLGGTLPEEGADPVAVIDALARGAGPGLVASAGPRYFGFVIGGSLPVALAADWLTSAWDQNAGLYAASPSAAVVEEVTASWILDLLGLPASAGVGFVTGGQMANFTALAAARHGVLRRHGWGVEEEGLAGAPPVQVIVGEEAHVTIFASLRLLGLGSRGVVRVPADDQGRMRPAELRRALETCRGPVIVCAQAGNVNTGAFDPLEEIVPACRQREAWLHVDGAFGLWAAASPERRALLAGAGSADSWALDAHKWLNVPYDSGVAIVADASAHRAAMTVSAPYLAQSAGRERDPLDWVPEFSRRARAFAAYAALRTLGRRGVAGLVERCCHLARLMADRLGRGPGVRILNEVVLNQVLVRFELPRGDSDAFMRAVIGRVQRDGTCWVGGTTWHGAAAMRLSISNWSTSEEDVERSAAAILEASRQEAETG
jgi:glutamate/tyrosine decarboxylase-like PLP-dependent enzyme